MASDFSVAWQLAFSGFGILHRGKSGNLAADSKLLRSAIAQIASVRRMLGISVTRTVLKSGTDAVIFKYFRRKIGIFDSQQS
jgi:hypothetical protein